MTVGGSSDVLELFNKGSQKAFQAIWQEFYPRLVFHVEQYVRDREQAKEIASDALYKCFLRRGKFDSISELRTFLYVAARNAAIDQYRSLKKLSENQKRYFDCLHQDNLENEQIYGELLKNELNASLEKLPPRTKKVIKLLYINQLSYQQVADLLSISINTVTSTRRNALIRMREDLGRKDIALVIGAIVTFFSIW